MVTKLHILLTYNCSLRCKHCYVFSDQRAPGKISLSQVSRILNDGIRIPSVRWIYFGGGEPFTQYTILLKSVQRAIKLGYNVGVETNGYFARTIEAGLRFLRPLAEMGIGDIRISNDILHYKNPDRSPASNAMDAAQKLGIPTTIVSIPSADEQPADKTPHEAGYSLDVPRLMFTGRAAKTMLAGKQSYPANQFTECPRKDLKFPEKFFIDAYGYVQVCPGIAIGNINEKSLDLIIADYNIDEHIIMSSLSDMGPLGLIQNTKLKFKEEYVDACHCCFSARHVLIDKYPEFLGPHQVYGY